MRALTLHEQAAVSGGEAIIGTIALLAVAGWIWQNREALNQIAQTASMKVSDLEAECGG
ncbi:MAG: hypothetical protein K0M70_02065 [Arenimonas sp.]|uniref:hypothetical protein n=1 Tax=Arenimonas sp. TaxID=1872635 RepID=UPI0025C57650|nr:hypothetical protein [Arenimonas sp.]MBW8366628.1 hypothetical protein [Arenimonas sp.]